jgi:uncharacterized membrane protein
MPPLLRKLFGVWVIGKTVSSTAPLFMRLLLGMAAITVLAVVGAILAAALIMGGLWLAYSQLVESGIEPAFALMILGAVILFLLGLVVLSARNYWRKLNLITRRLVYRQAPISGRLSSIADAFIDGLLTDTSQPRPR